MKVIVEFDSWEEASAAMGRVVGAVPSQYVTPETAVAAQSYAPAPAPTLPQAAQAYAQAPAPLAAPAPSAEITKAQIIQAAQDHAKRNSPRATKAVFEKFGAKSAATIEPQFFAQAMAEFAA